MWGKESHKMEVASVESCVMGPAGTTDCHLYWHVEWDLVLGIQKHFEEQVQHQIQQQKQGEASLCEVEPHHQ